jgi:hypothetical protein
MVNSSRSRKQLQKGVILKKWNGDPLIQADATGLGSDDGGNDTKKTIAGSSA